MTMAAQTREPLWHATAENVDARGVGMLDLSQVASATGLSAATIQVALNSEANTGRRARLRALARPKWNYQGIPLWSAEQVGDYHRIVAARWRVREEFADLPTLDAAEVIRNQMGSLRALSRLSGVPLTTLHRWKLAATFPEPAALMKGDSPIPRVLYSWPALRECIKRHHAGWLTDHPEVNIDGLEVTDANV